MMSNTRRINPALTATQSGCSMARTEMSMRPGMSPVWLIVRATCRIGKYGVCLELRITNPRGIS